MTKHGFKDATLDEARIREWWNQTPNANVAIATGPSKLLVVDIDHGAHPDKMPFDFERTYMVRTGRRPEYGVQIYFQADGSRNCAGWKRNGCSGDVRAEGGYVMAAGSIHPESGEAYICLLDAPLAPPPQWVKDLAPEKATFDPATAVDGATVEEWKMWLLEYAAHNKLNVRDFERRVPNGAWVGIECPWLHAGGPGVESSTVLGVLSGKLAFECSHGTCKTAKRDTAVFKAEMARLNGDFPKREPGADPEVVIGSPKLKPEPAKLSERMRPVYPMNAWDGTVVGTFARLCGDDNNVPLKMYAEAFRCVLGAVVGDRLSCPTVEGALPRTYTIIVAPKGKGKGTAIRRAQQFFSRPCDGESSTSGSGGVRVSFSDPLLSGKHDFMWKPKGIGAYMAAASSVPGMAKLIKEPDSTAKNKPQFTWGGTLPRLISVHEEMKTFLSALFIEGGVGSA